MNHITFHFPPDGATVFLPASENMTAAATAAHELAAMMRDGCIVTLEDSHGRVATLEAGNLPAYADFMTTINKQDTEQ